MTTNRLALASIAAILLAACTAQEQSDGDVRASEMEAAGPDRGAGADVLPPRSGGSEREQRALPRADASAGGEIRGTIRGTQVTLAHADYDGQLNLFAGDSWGSGPSLVIFFFGDEDDFRAGRSIVVGPESSGSTPHIHYRWIDPESGEIESEVATSDYQMRIDLEEKRDGRLPGSFELRIPGEQTELKGRFAAEIER